MKPVDELTNAELIAEWREHWAKKRWDVEEAARVEALDAAMLKRMPAEDGEQEIIRERLVAAFAQSAATATIGLWTAHGGRLLTSGDIKAFSQTLFDFFSKIR